MLLHTKIVLKERVINMLSSSLAGTKVTAATRVQTVKRNTTVRAATQKMGAKGKKRGGKVRAAFFLFRQDGKLCSSNLFRFEGGERYLGLIFLSSRQEREIQLWHLFSLSPRKRARRWNLCRVREPSSQTRRIVSSAELSSCARYRSSNEGESVCVFSFSHLQRSTVTLFSSFL